MERIVEERAYRVIMVCEVGTGLGSSMGLRRAHIYSTLIELYARYRV